MLTIEHKLGQIVYGDEVDKEQRVMRLHHKRRFKVVHGTSCEDCGFHGLGHTICLDIACERESRSDGNDVVYEEVEDV